MRCCFRNTLIITKWNVRNLLRILVGNGWIGWDLIHSHGLPAQLSHLIRHTEPHSTVIMCPQRSEENRAFIITNYVSAYYVGECLTHIPLNQGKDKCKFELAQQGIIFLFWIKQKTMIIIIIIVYIFLSDGDIYRTSLFTCNMHLRSFLCFA